MFEGVPAEDKIDGTVHVEAGGQTFDADWAAERSTENEDVVGAWELRIETPNGETLTPTLNLKLKEGKLDGSYDSQIGPLDVSDISLKKNKLKWTIDTDYNGTNIVLNFSGIPRGSKIAGVVEYDFGGETGEVDFEGTLKAEEKKREN